MADRTRICRITCLLLCILTSVFFPVSLSAQNFVPNPGFETFTSCPTQVTGSFQNEIAKASPWNHPTGGTSDFFHACNPNNNCVPFGTVDVPCNQLGWQMANSGNGYGGLITFNATFGDYREYLQAPLMTTLNAGQTYIVSFYVSLANLSNFGTDRLGAHFSNGPVTAGGFGPLAVTPQVETLPGFTIMDTMNWYFVYGTFVASGGENYITVGNFVNDATIATSPTGNANFPSYAYYYVDDICITRDGRPDCGTAPLAVVFKDFHARLRDRGTELRWITVDETNHDYFGIERSLDGKVFEEIGKMNGKSAGGAAYLYEDPYRESAWYRLRLVDRDGDVAYSPVVHTNSMAKESFNIGPNPAKEELQVQLSLAKAQDISLVLRAVDGTVVLEKSYAGTAEGQHVIRFEIGEISAGIYTAVIRIGKEIRYKRLLIQR